MCMYKHVKIQHKDIELHTAIVHQGFRIVWCPLLPEKSQLKPYYIHSHPWTIESQGQLCAWTRSIDSGHCFDPLFCRMTSLSRKRYVINITYVLVYIKVYIIGSRSSKALFTYRVRQMPAGLTARLGARDYIFRVKPIGLAKFIPKLIFWKEINTSTRQNAGPLFHALYSRVHTGLYIVNGWRPHLCVCWLSTMYVWRWFDLSEDEELSDSYAH